MTSGEDNNLDLESFLKSFRKARNHLELHKRVPVDNPKAFALELLNSLPEKNKNNILEKIKNRDEELYQAARNQISTLDTLKILSAQSFKELIKKVSLENLCIALKQIDEVDAKEIFQKVPGSEGVRLFKEWRITKTKKIKISEFSKSRFKLIKTLNTI